MEFLQTTLGAKDTNCEPVVTSGQHNLTSQHPPPRDASPAGLVGILVVGSFSNIVICDHIAVRVCRWINLFFISFQTFVHCRRDFNRVSFKGHWNCRGVGPNAWNEGVTLPFFSLNVKLFYSDN